MSMEDFFSPNDVFVGNEEYSLNIVYGNGLDDGPTFVDDHACLMIVTN
jgi:hypothetical protein